MNGHAYEESYQTCPYDPAHRILRHRFITHLVKCRRNYSGKHTAICPFNSGHVINTPEFKYHVDTCENRNQIDQAITAPDNAGPTIKIDFGPGDHIETDENWDDNAVPSYDPTAYLEKQRILRRLDTASRADRRLFQEAERRRFQEIDQSNQPPLPPPSASIRAPSRPPPSPACLPSAQPPPLSEILTSARAAGASTSADAWQQAPTRGRGRALKNNK